jgi:hypothetical protein
MLAAPASAMSDLCMWSPRPTGRAPVSYSGYGGSPRETSGFLSRFRRHLTAYSLAEIWCARLFRHAGENAFAVFRGPPHVYEAAIGAQQ